MSILVYDGGCGLCNRSVTKLREWDRKGRLSFLPSQDPEAREILAPRGLFELTSDTLIWVDGDKTQVRSAAVIRALWRIGGWRWVQGSLVWLIPKPLRDAGYNWVARNRHKL